jgi:hypothetical protein
LEIGGALSLVGGAGSMGGRAIIAGGAGNAGPGGSVHLEAGKSSGLSTGGAVKISGGMSPAGGEGGSVSIIAGTSLKGLAIGGGVSIEGGRFYYWINNTANLVTTLTSTAYKNKWVHFAICRSSGITKIYMNGISIFSISARDKRAARKK